MNKKGQGAGMISGLVFGIASLIIGVIVSLVIVSTLTGAGLITAATEQDYAVGNLSNNFTTGIANVSLQIPTVLLVAAIVLIIGILAVLVGVWQRMRIGGSAI